MSVEGMDIKNFSHKSYQYAFVLMDKNDPNPIYFAADTEGILVWWKSALQKAATGAGSKLDYSECYTTLGLPVSDVMSLDTVTKAYRNAALKAHPDKGGDPAEVLLFITFTLFCVA